MGPAVRKATILGKGNACTRESLTVYPAKEDRQFLHRGISWSPPDSGNTVNKPTTVNLRVLPQAFRDAIKADLAASTGWTTLRDAVSVCTRQLRAHDYYPERVLVAIKSAVTEAATHLVHEKAADEIVTIAAQFCIAAYFDTLDVPTADAVSDRPPVAIPRGIKTPGTSELPNSHANGV